MEEDPSHRRVGTDQIQNFQNHLEQNRWFRRAAGGTLAVWSVAVGAVGINHVTDECRRDETKCVVEYDEESMAYIDNINELAVGEPQQQTEPSASTTTTTAAPLPTEASTTTIELTTAQKLGLELDPRVETAIESMNLTKEGYHQFLQSIDSSPLSFSQQFREFNPDLLSADIPQGKSEIFVAHFTVKYANDQPGFGDTMVGNFNVSNLIQSMASRFGLGGKCCGTNWGIGRHATTHQMAPLDAKLNHNPPYDSISTGVEIEANEQASITADQYDELSYLAIAVLDTQNRLGKFPLNQIFKGHGEMRDKWNHENPHNKFNVRDDFDAPEMIFLRHKIQKFLDQHPELIGQRPLKHLP